MKTIFVTVKEFFDNGGQMSEGRQLYTKAPNYDTYIPTFKFLERMSVYPGDSLIRVSRGQSSFPSVQEVTYVEIPVTPIYK